MEQLALVIDLVCIRLASPWQDRFWITIVDGLLRDIRKTLSVAWMHRVTRWNTLMHVGLRREISQLCMSWSGC